MNYRLPIGLRAPRHIGVFSPSGAFADTAEKLALFERGIAQIEHAGYSVRESPHCRGSWHQASAPPEVRIADLTDLLLDPDIDVILPSIGGHVAAELLPLLDLDALGAAEKVLFGFSDNSILPLVTTARTGLCTFHTLCDVTFGFGRFSDSAYALTQKSFAAALRERQFDLSGSGRWRPVQSGKAEGVLLGGNLTGLTFLAGTPWWPDWRGKVLFWESVDSHHAVVQHLVHLANAGAFKDLAGMLIGRVSTLKEGFYRPDQVIPIATLLLDGLGLRGRFPIAIEADIGHDVDNVTLPLGASVRLRVDEGVAATVQLP